MYMYTLPQAPVSPKDIQQIMKIIHFFKNMKNNKS